MCPIQPEVIEKLIEAKRLEKEAIALMLPPQVKGHLEVIMAEVEAMVLELLLERKAESAKVKKVPIG